MGLITKRLYKSVDQYDVETLDYVVATGKKIYINKLVGNAARSPEVKVEIINDPDTLNELLLVTHGDSYQDISPIEIIGADQKIRIRLVNDSGTTEAIGGFWEGEVYNA